MPFESINDAKIAELIAMPKSVANPRTHASQKQSHEQYNYILRGEGGQEFNLYKRQNLQPGMEDDFSCGLAWITPNGEPFTLVRYNGSSHAHPNHLEGEMLGYVTHIHRATEKYIQANKKADGFAEVSLEYRTLSGALFCLIRDCNVEGITSEPDQPQLPGL